VGKISNFRLKSPFISLVTSLPRSWDHHTGGGVALRYRGRAL